MYNYGAQTYMTGFDIQMCALSNWSARSRVPSRSVISGSTSTKRPRRGTRPRSASWTRLSNKWKVSKYAEWHVGEDPRTVFSFGSLVKLFVSTLFLSRVARASVELFVTEHESIMQVVIFLLSHSTQLDLALEVLAQSVELCA